ncbi:hypothetical protein BDB00DRAFT_807453 [Zychaea mexicana]|uniref:uncharacterized protein n=1 Tax=Zychaea mexicana TaxID=64656 RepID=UPI0022FF34AC|nr:uncharacterized protein BDB00DRAFT_807453 [Zychaea mexicana]KAI9496832.1 hypothetical protein BDB00DRAFT_807453 [Zychaea mexicana]
MLYLPWRDEEFDNLLVNREEEFRLHQEQILRNSRKYCSFDDAQLMAALDHVAARSEDNEEEEDPQRRIANPLDEFELEGEQHVDVMAQTGAYERVPYQETFAQPDRLPNDQYENMIAALNTEQRFRSSCKASRPEQRSTIILLFDWWSRHWEKHGNKSFVSDSYPSHR